MEQNRTYRILLDEKWTLEELTEFTRVFFQNYSFLYCLDRESVDVASFRVKSVLEKYELRHGLSYVNIYAIFRGFVPMDDRPKIKSIQYNSPGWIDLLMNPEVATQFAKSIGIYLGTPLAVAGTYKKLYKIYRELANERKEKKNDSLKLERERVKEVQKLNNQLAQGLGFKSLKALDKHTKDIEESSKLIMAHYRRMEKTAKFVQSGKVEFPESLHEKDS